MKCQKFFQFVRQISTSACAIILSSAIAAMSIYILPSQAALTLPTVVPTPSKETVAPPKLPAEIKSGSFVTAAVNRVGPAVVLIETEKTITSRETDPLLDDPFFRRFFGDEFAPKVPQQQLLRGEGSGFIIDKSGIILTNAHVVNDADKVTVTLKDGRTLKGKVQGTDGVTDLAIVKINNNGEDLPVAPLGDSSKVQVGDWAIAVGNPFGLNNTVTLGIISTLNRSSVQAGIPDKRIDFIQTDAAINPGNSGGPLLNDQGEVIGINTAIRANATGIGFAIPINTAKAIQAELAQGKKISHPYIGVQIANLTPTLAQENNSDPNSLIILPEINGVLVVRIIPHTPAATSGLRVGDVIVAIDEQPTAKAEELQSIVEKSKLGQKLQVQVYRGNQKLALSIKTAALKTEEEG